MARNITPTEQKKVRQTQFIALVRGIPGKKLPLSIRAACDAVEISRQTFFNWKKSDPDFQAAWNDAWDDGADLVEDEALRRAVEGVEEPVYQGGVLVGRKRVYSDKLMERMLEARKPGLYGRNTQVAVQVNNVAVEADDAQLARALALLIAETKNKQLVPQNG